MRLLRYLCCSATFDDLLIDLLVNKVLVWRAGSQNSHTKRVRYPSAARSTSRRNSSPTSYLAALRELRLARAMLAKIAERVDTDSARDLEFAEYTSFYFQNAIDAICVIKLLSRAVRYPHCPPAGVLENVLRPPHKILVSQHHSSAADYVAWTLHEATCMI